MLPKSRTQPICWHIHTTSARSSAGCSSRSASYSEYGIRLCVRPSPQGGSFNPYVCLSTQLSIPPRSEAVEVAVETRGGAEIAVRSERRDPALLRQQRALLPKAWSIMGKIRGEREADSCGEGGAEHEAGGKNREQIQSSMSVYTSDINTYLCKNEE